MKYRFQNEAIVTWDHAKALIEDHIHTILYAQGKDGDEVEKIDGIIMEQIMEDAIAPTLQDGDLTVQFIQDDEDPDEQEIWINFGARDWQFDTNTGELNGCGTFIG